MYYDAIAKCLKLGLTPCLICNGSWEHGPHVMPYHTPWLQETGASWTITSEQFGRAKQQELVGHYMLSNTWLAWYVCIHGSICKETVMIPWASKYTLVPILAGTMGKLWKSKSLQCAAKIRVACKLVIVCFVCLCTSCQWFDIDEAQLPSKANH